MTGSRGGHAAAVLAGGSCSSQVGWVEATLGIRLDVRPSGPGAGRFGDALEIGLRRNPNRAQLLVSRVLGKHIPVPASVVLSAAHELGSRARAACGGLTPTVLGFAETATALGHGVAAVGAADGSQAPYLHTTRRPAPAGAQVVSFCEEHSHATNQALALLDDAMLRGGRPLVLVDDELTTGTTAVNAIRALHAAWPRDRYVLASLVDCRDEARRAEVTQAVAELGAVVVSVCLLDGSVELPPGVPARVAEFAGELAPSSGRRQDIPRTVRWLDVTLPAGLPPTAMLGWGPDQEDAARRCMGDLAATLPVASDRRTLVLGDEELMYLPQLLACALGGQVRTSTVTRTPALAIDEPGYPLRTVLSFSSTEDGTRPAYAYNVAPSTGADPGNAPGFEDIVLVTDAADRSTVAPLAGQLARCASRSVHVITLRSALSPRSPAGTPPLGQDSHAAQ